MKPHKYHAYVHNVSGYKRKMSAFCLLSQVPLAVIRSNLYPSCLCCSLVLFQHSVETFAVTSRLQGAETTVVNAVEKRNTECSQELEVACMQEEDGEPQHWFSILVAFSLVATFVIRKGTASMKNVEQ